MAAEDKLKLLIRRLAAKTEEGAISWERTVDDGVFQATFGSFLVKIFGSGSLGDQDIWLQILDENGNVLDEMVDTQFKSPDVYKMMYDTLHIARRHALGSERAINELLKQLGAVDAESNRKGTAAAEEPPEDEIPF